MPEGSMLFGHAVLCLVTFLNSFRLAAAPWLVVFRVTVEGYGFCPFCSKTYRDTNTFKQTKQTPHKHIHTNRVGWFLLFVDDSWRRCANIGRHCTIAPLKSLLLSPLSSLSLQTPHGLLTQLNATWHPMRRTGGWQDDHRQAIYWYIKIKFLKDNESVFNCWFIGLCHWMMNSQKSPTCYFPFHLALLYSGHIWLKSHLFPLRKI